MFQRIRPCQPGHDGPGQVKRSLENLDLRSARTFLSAANDERDALVFFESLVTRALNFTVVREEVFAAELGHDEAEALVVVEPLHNTSFCFQCLS